MRLRWKRLPSVVVLIFSFGRSVFACEPCAETLDFEGTVAEASLILIGKVVGLGPHSHFGEDEGGPNWIKVKAGDVLKGKIAEKHIKVNSWDAMCAYGIMETSGWHVMLLAGADSSGIYPTVRWGCAVTSYPIKNKKVLFGKEEIGLKRFIEMVNDLLSERDPKPSKAYYDRLESGCEKRQSKSCCRASVQAMRRGGYLRAEGDSSGKCPKGFKRNMMKCIDSYRWCTPAVPSGDRPN